MPGIWPVLIVAGGYGQSRVFEYTLRCHGERCVAAQASHCLLPWPAARQAACTVTLFLYLNLYSEGAAVISLHVLSEPCRNQVDETSTDVVLQMHCTYLKKMLCGHNIRPSD